MHCLHCCRHDQLEDCALQSSFLVACVFISIHAVMFVIFKVRLVGRHIRRFFVSSCLLDLLVISYIVIIYLIYTVTSDSFSSQLIHIFITFCSTFLFQYIGNEQQLIYIEQPHFCETCTKSYSAWSNLKPHKPDSFM